LFLHKLYRGDYGGSIRKGGKRRSFVFGKKSDSPKKKSPLDALIEAIDQLGPGQQLLYKLGEMYGPEIIIVEVKKDFNGKGHKYSVIGSPPVNGKPGPQRNTIWETGKAKAIASWLLLRVAEPFA
jgi:hypothetical protein